MTTEMREVVAPIAVWMMSKGYGFIRVEGLDDIFIHISRLKEADANFVMPGLNTKVRVTIRHGEKGWRVDRVKEIIS